MTRNNAAKASDLLARARSALAAGSADEARRICAACLKLDRGNCHAQHFMAKLAWAANDRPAAVAHAGKAAKLAPHSHEIRLDFARMLLMSGNGRWAIREANAALALRPNDVQARIEHAKILYNSHQPLEAEPHLQSIAADYPDEGVAHAMLATLRMESGRVESALESADRAIASGLASADLGELRGRALVALDRPKEAVDAFRRVLKLQPNRLVALRGYSYACGRTGDREIAHRATRLHTKLLPFEKVGPDDARLKVLVSESLGPAAAFDNKHLQVAYIRGNYISSLDHPDIQRIHYPGENVDPEAVLRDIGGAQVLFVNNANAESIALFGQPELLARTHAATGLPIINPIGKVMLTSREQNYRRLGDDPAYVFPRTIRYDVGDDPMGAARRILSEFDPPFLVRPTTTNLRGGLRLIESAAEFREAPGLQPNLPYYAIEYHKSAMKTPVDGEEGAFQFRASVVGGQIVPDRFVWGPGAFTPPKVNRIEFDYHGRGLSDYEREFLNTPEKIIGAPLQSIFGGLVKTLDLDIFGIDFGFTKDGRIIVFEANASMNLFNPRYESYAPYRREHRTYFHDAVVKHFDKRAAEELTKRGGPKAIAPSIR